MACYAKVFAVGGSVTIKTCKNDGRRQVLHTPFNFSKKFLGVCRLSGAASAAKGLLSLIARLGRGMLC